MMKILAVCVCVTAFLYCAIVAGMSFIFGNIMAGIFDSVLAATNLMLLIINLRS